MQFSESVTVKALRLSVYMVKSAAMDLLLRFCNRQNRAHPAWQFGVPNMSNSSDLSIRREMGLPMVRRCTAILAKARAASLESEDTPSQIRFE